MSSLRLLSCSLLLTALIPLASTAQQETQAEGGFRPLSRAKEAAGSVIGAVEPVIELFDTELADTLSKYRLELSFDPKARDFLDEDYVRLPVELRYGLTSNTELYTELESYMPNLLQGEGDFGLAYWRIGGKHQLDLNSPYWKAAAGLDLRAPLSDPPPEPVDGYLRVEPYFVIEKELRSISGAHVFANVGYQFVDYWGGYVPETDHIFRHDNVRITAGIIQYRGIWNPLFRAEYRWEIQGPDRVQSWFVEPGVLIDLPRRWTSRLPGKWKVEAGLAWEDWDGEGELEFNIRVKWRVRLSELGIR